MQTAPEAQAHNDFRNQYRQIQKPVNNRFALILIAVEGNGGNCAEHGGNNGADNGDKQAVHKGLQHAAVLEQRSVPVKRKACPYSVNTRFVKGIQREN